MGVSSSQGAVERLKALRGEEDREREVEGGGRPQAAGCRGGWQCGGDQTDGGGRGGWMAFKVYRRMHNSQTSNMSLRSSPLIPSILVTSQQEAQCLNLRGLQLCPLSLPQCHYTQTTTSLFVFPPFCKPLLSFLLIVFSFSQEVTPDTFLPPFPSCLHQPSPHSPLYPIDPKYLKSCKAQT